MDVENFDYHVFWSDKDSTVADRVEGEPMHYRKVSNSSHLQNTLKKNFGNAEQIKQAIDEGKLRIVMGAEIRPVPTTNYELNGIPLEG